MTSSAGALAAKPDPAPSAPIVIVVGMHSEARLATPLGRVVVGAGGLTEALRGGVGGVLSFGLCGGLDATLAPGDLVIGTEVRSGAQAHAADRDWLERLTQIFPTAMVGGVAGVDAIVATRDAKVALRERTGAIAADMESHHAARAALEAGVPFAILRAVSDGAADDLPMSAQLGFRPDGTVDIVAVVRGLFARPGELPALIRTARHAGAAFRALGGAAKRSGAAR